MKNIAIIGAGMSGLSLAHHLSDQFNVTLFEKSSKPGGRICSRQTESGNFDHGAQFFYAKTSAFQQFITPMLTAGVIANWQARFVEIDAENIVASRQWDDSYPHYVGTPSMAAIGAFVAQSLRVHYSHQISAIERNDKTGKWHLFNSGKQITDSFDWVVLTMPVAQVLNLTPAGTSFIKPIQSVEMLPCYALMLGLSETPHINFDAALIRNSNLSWLSFNGTKPQRGKQPTIVTHAANQWALDHLSTDTDDVKAMMLETVLKLTHLAPKTIIHSDIKRWVYANVDKQAISPFYIDSNMQIATCGDWCIQGRVESAFSSGVELAKQLNEFNN